MYTAIFLIVGFIVFITISALLGSKITKDEIGQPVLTALFFFILVISYFFIIDHFSGENYKEKYKYYEIEITALQDNIGTEGNRYCNASIKNNSVEIFFFIYDIHTAKEYGNIFSV
jgi:hypothetical protein